jgi:CheY-like chemotaxis protein
MEDGGRTKGEQHPAPEPAPPSGRGGTLLVVEDEGGAREVTARLLEQAGFQVLEAGDGPEAVELFRRRGPEVEAVLLDLTMPGMNGEEVFQALRQLRPDVPVLLMSGFDEQSVTGRFAGEDLDGFLLKPYRVDDLLGAVHRALARRRKGAG